MKTKKQVTIWTVIIGILLFGGVGYFFDDYLRPPFGGELIKEPIAEELKLKAPKEKILDYREKTIYYKELVLGSDVKPKIATSTATTTDTSTIPIIDIPQYNIISETFIEYDYISDIITDRVPYYDNKDDNFANAEYLKIRDDGKTPIAFYSEDLWAKDENGTIFEIAKNATTTVEAFEEQTKITLLEKLKSYFARNALAIDTYNSSGTYTPDSAGNIEILVVAGGGGGCFDRGGAGGAGGLIYNSSFSVTAQEYSITVGSGGTGSTNSSEKGSNGNNSVFSTLTAIGGGGGGTGEAITAVGADGGSGGGGGNNGSTNPAAGGSATSGQGYDGGQGVYTAPNYGAGGGGGASEVGTDGTSTSSGNGGDGLSYDISGTATYYAGGGGAGSYLGGTDGDGGLGGGGDGSQTAPTDGTDNTGGGGGSGGGGGEDTSYGADGGSGVIIIVEAAASDTCTPTLDGVWKMDLQDHCTTTVSTYSDYGMECYNPVGGSWVIGANTEVRRGSSTNCLPQIEGTGVFSIQPIH